MTEEEIAAQESAKANENETLTALMEEIKGIGETISSMDERINAIANPTPVEIPLDPALDPDMAPPADWKALREETRAEAERIADEKLQSKEEERLTKAEEEKAAEKEWDSKFEEQAAKAVEEGFLPPVEDPRNHDDAGNAARRDLFGFAHFLNQTDLLKVAETVKLYNDQGKHFDIDQGKWIQSTYRAAGKSVPIGSSANRVSNSSTPMSYKELHQSSMDTLARKAKQKYGIV
jgi:hypothetical protein